MDFTSVGDSELLAALKQLAAQERGTIADTLACMAEVQRRGVLERTAHPNLFLHCVRELKMSEDTAYRRVRAMKVAQRLPEAYSLLRDGQVNLTTLSLIEPHIAQHPDLLRKITGKSKREVERLVAGIAALPERPDAVRFVAVPDPKPSPQPPELPFRRTSPAPEPSAAPSEPVPQRVVRAELRFTAAEDFLAAVEELRALLWHKYPAGRLGDILFEAVRDFLERRDPRRARNPCKSREPLVARRRKAPAPLAREVARRDGRRCAYVSADAKRCGETRGLELDHVTPFALGGRSDDADNLRLLCRAHNQAEARRVFGERRA